MLNSARKNVGDGRERKVGGHEKGQKKRRSGESMDSM